MDIGEGGWEDWAKVGDGDDTEEENGSSSSAEVVQVAPGRESARFMVRRDSSDSVEIMSVKEEDCDLHDEALDEHKDLLPKMHCSTCSTLIMNQSMTSSMIHVKMEEIETQTDLPMPKVSTCEQQTEMKPSDFELKMESQIERALDSISEFLNAHGRDLATLIPSHLIFAMLVLSTAYLGGYVRVAETPIESTPLPTPSSVLNPSMTQMAKSSVTQCAVETSSVAATNQPVQDLQSPEWLERLLVLLDGVSDELQQIDTQVGVVERQLDQMDREMPLGQAGKSQLAITESYRQLADKQRQVSHSLEQIRSIVSSQQNEEEEDFMKESRSKLVEVSSSLVSMNWRLNEQTLANKRRHANVVKRASQERQRLESAFLAQLVERLRSANAGKASLPLLDEKSPACRKLFGSNQLVIAADVVECTTRSRAFAAESLRQLNATLEQERSQVARFRDRAIKAERTVSDLREDLFSLHNRTLFLQQQNAKLYQLQLQLEKQQNQAKSFLQCFSQCSPSVANSFAELLRRPEHCATCDLIDKLTSQFVAMLDRLSQSLLDNGSKEWSVRTLLEMLSQTFSTLTLTTPPTPPVKPPTSNQQQPVITQRPVITKSASSFSNFSNSTWSSRLRSKLGSVKATLTRAYDRLRKSVVQKVPVFFRSLAPSNFSRDPSTCSALERDFERAQARVESLQHDRMYYDAATLNGLFNDDINSLNKRLQRDSQCLDRRARFFVECQLAWAKRMMQLFRYNGFCSDVLPSGCQYQPWQQHLMASIEMTSAFTIGGQFYTSNTTSSEENQKQEAVKAPTSSPSDAPRPAGLYHQRLFGPPAPMALLPTYSPEHEKRPLVVLKEPVGKKGDDGSWDLEDPQMQCDHGFVLTSISSSPVRDMVVVRRTRFQNNRHQPYCRADATNESSEIYGPEMPRFPRIAPFPKSPEDEAACRNSQRDLILIRSTTSADASLVFDSKTMRMHA